MFELVAVYPDYKNAEQCVETKWQEFRVGSDKLERVKLERVKSGGGSWIRTSEG